VVGEGGKTDTVGYDCIRIPCRFERRAESLKINLPRTNSHTWTLRVLMLEILVDVEHFCIDFVILYISSHLSPTYLVNIKCRYFSELIPPYVQFIGSTP
jgi:hypothetical protein